MRKSYGFTLAELLIALAILGVIATFTIPKVLSAATSGQNTAIAKEAAGMISGAFMSYSLTDSVTASTTAGAITPFMNYVKTVDTGAITGMGTACGAVDASMCYVMHNGGYLMLDGDSRFDGDGDSAIEPGEGMIFNFDPDGNGAQTEITFVLYDNGRLTTGGNSGAVTEDAGFDQVATDPAYLANWN